MDLYSTQLHRKAALAFGILAPCLQLGRSLLWGYWPPLSQLPVDIDGYLAGALLIAGALLQSRSSSAGRLLTAAGWGFFAGILYRSFFEQLANPARHGGHEWVVMAVKGLLLAGSVLGIIGAARARPPLPSDRGAGGRSPQA